MKQKAAASSVLGPNLGWILAGVLLVALIFVSSLRVLQQSGESADSQALPPSPGGTAAVDISSMSPREVADRLFNRVMSSAEAGDSADVAFFLSKAIESHEMARPLDADGLFHLALLHRTAGDHQAALAAAREVLDGDPEHLLNLSAAAEASVALQDMEAAEGYYRHLLEVLEAELARGREEYQLHQALVSRLRTDAEAFLQGR